MGKAAAALTTLHLLLPWMCTGQKPHEFPTCLSATRLPPGHGLPSSRWIVLAPAVLGDGLGRGKHPWDQDKLVREKGHRDQGLKRQQKHTFFSSRTFPEAAVVAGVLWGEHGVLSDAF